MICSISMIDDSTTLILLAVMRRFVTKEGCHILSSLHQVVSEQLQKRILGVFHEVGSEKL